MTTIPSDVVAYIRNQVTGLLSETATIKTIALGVDSNGDPTRAPVTVASGVACRVLPARSGSTSDAELLANKQIVGDVARIILPYDTTLEAGYQVIVNEITWLVISIEDSRTSETDRQVIATRQR